VGETVALEANISVENADSETVLMRHKTASSCLTSEELGEEPWQPYLSSIDIPFQAISGWVGVYLNVQLQDEEGRISNVLCDDISVEGLPQEIDGSTQEIARLTFENNLDVPICFIQVIVKPISQEINLATIGDPLLSGEVREIPVNVNNTIDFEIYGCENQLIENISGMLIPEEGVYFSINPNAVSSLQAPIQFVSNVDVPFCKIELISNAMELNVLIATESDPILPDEVRTWMIDVGADYSFEIEDCNGNIDTPHFSQVMTEDGVIWHLSPSIGLGKDDENLANKPRADIQFISNVDVPICQIDVVSPAMNLDVVIATETDPILPDEIRTQQIYVGEEFSFIVADCDGFILDSIEAMVMPEEGVVWHLSPSTGRGAD
jgi:hypothetical protein